MAEDYINHLFANESDMSEAESMHIDEMGLGDDDEVNFLDNHYAEALNRDRFRHDEEFAELMEESRNHTDRPTVWVMKDGKKIAIKDMATSHLRNSINMMLRKNRSDVFHGLIMGALNKEMDRRGLSRTVSPVERRERKPCPVCRGSKVRNGLPCFHCQKKR